MLQMHVIDHTSGDEMPEARNVLKESARIARGAVSPLSDLTAGDADALIIPGGFGAAKNLSNFAVAGPEMELEPEVDRVIKSFHAASKPIGLCCIAPVLAAKSIPGCSVTLGSKGDGWPYGDATDFPAAVGSTHVPKEPTGVHLDEDNKIVTSPAYMADAGPGTVHVSVGGMVTEVLKLA